MYVPNNKKASIRFLLGFFLFVFFGFFLINIRYREVDNRWVFFHKEVVLGESFDAKDEVRWQLGQLEPFEEILFVGFIFLNAK